MTDAPQAQQTFSQLYPDLFAALTPFEAHGLDEALSAGRLDGLTYTRDDVARLVEAITGDLSTTDFLERLR
jgi:hypothetical protein